MRFIPAVLCLALPTAALAAVPDFVSYSGRLTDGTGWGQSQTVKLTVWLCETPQGDVGECVWSEPHEAVPVEDGYFSVSLGEVVPLPKPLPEGLWITVAVEGTAPLGPWEQVGAVPFALKAAEVASTGGDSILKAMKLALGFSDDPGDDNYLSDAAFRTHQRGECPLGYERADDPKIPATGFFCRKPVAGGKFDEMVKVGDFWIDRYEASVWAESDCVGGPGGSYGQVDGDMHNDGFFRNGTDTPLGAALYACSVAGVPPARYVTWFQAAQACAANGKHLAMDWQWLVAASGTPDGADDADPGDDSEECNIWPNSKPAGSTWAVSGKTTMTGTALLCVSRYGAFDMVGNLQEWTATWQGGPSASEGAPGWDDPALAQEYHGDGMWNVTPASVQLVQGNYLPPASIRSGGYTNGTRAGVFTLLLSHSPVTSAVDIGFRCALDE